MVSPNTSPADNSEQGDPAVDDSDVGASARELRMIAIVESFLRQVRSGGSLDPETHLRGSEELREDLEPLLLTILRLEACAIRIEGLAFGDGQAKFLLEGNGPHP